MNLSDVDRTMIKMAEAIEKAADHLSNPITVENIQRRSRAHIRSEDTVNNALAAVDDILRKMAGHYRSTVTPAAPAPPADRLATEPFLVPRTASQCLRIHRFGQTCDRPGCTWQGQVERAVDSGA